jgi:hypothetical protein
MATPIYKGAVQPAANSGWLSGIGSWFGASAPAYGVPAVKPAVVAATPTPTVAPAVAGTCEPDRITLVIPRDLIGSQQLIVSASPDGDVPSDDGERITLVIPRSLIQSQQ